MKSLGLCPHRTKDDLHEPILAEIVEVERRCGFEFTITRSCYCPECNKKVGGAPHSAHMKESHACGKSKAYDISVENSNQRFLIVKNAIDRGFVRIEVRDTWIHLDGGLEADGFGQNVIFLK